MRLCSVLALSSLVAVSGFAGEARAALNHFSFAGSIDDGSHFYPYSASMTAAGVGIGDAVKFSFDLDTSVSNSGTGAETIYLGAVQNIVFTDTTRSYTIKPGNTAFTIYPFSGGPAFYRFDVALPGNESDYFLNFWFRETTHNLSGALPSVINSDDFNYLHAVSIFHPVNGNNSEVFGATINTTPEPAALTGLAVVGLLGLRRRRA